MKPIIKKYLTNMYLILDVLYGVPVKKPHIVHQDGYHLVQDNNA